MSGTGLSVERVGKMLHESRMRPWLSGLSVLKSL